MVIVDDMDHAVRMSNRGGGLRFVTLDGEVINAGGAITRRWHKNKTANILDRKAEIQTLQKISTSGPDRDDVARKLESLREVCAVTCRDGRAGRRNSQVQSGILLEKARTEADRSAFVEIRSSSQRLDRELSSIETEKKHSAEMVEALQKKIAEHTEAIAKAEAAAEACLEEYQKQKEQFDDISEEITS